jgi:DNA mismatch endonuclease (patch repair protein)
MDIFAKKKRSQIMSRIKGKDTGIERDLASAMKIAGLNGVVYQKKMLGKPDFVFEKQKIAVFCDGDFWHGYRFATWKNKLDPFWFNKISTNMKRDKKINRKLRMEGWIVLRFWGHQIQKNPKNCIAKIRYRLYGQTK